MTDERLASLRPRIQSRWDAERTSRVLQALDRRSRRSRVARAGFGLGAAGVFSATVMLYAHLHWKGGPAREGLALAMTATLLDADSVVVPEPDAAGRGFTVERGGARFVVAHDARHPFRVHVRDLLIEDVGTVFTVRLLPNAVAVAVDEGRVRVTTGANHYELGPREERTFDLETPAAEGLADAGAVPLASGERPHEQPLALARRPEVPAWRRLAENGQYREAFEGISRGGLGIVRDDVGELLLAADTARLSGHPADAVPYLEQAVRQHTGDQRLSLASFTLGRVLLDELGRPAEAARAFNEARSGELAEDALAREVEAWSRGGDTTRARDLALEYEKLYPNGRRSRSVAKFGGLE